MTRHRPGGAIRVLTSCARCNGSLPNGTGRRDVAFLVVDGRRVAHELAVCRGCDAEYAAAPTWMEREALARDAAAPVEAMEFAGQWHHSLARVQGTARHFLGEARCDALVPALRQEYVAQRERADERWETYRGRVASRDFIPDYDGDDDDLPF